MFIIPLDFANGLSFEYLHIADTEYVCPHRYKSAKITNTSSSSRNNYKSLYKNRGPTNLKPLTPKANKAMCHNTAKIPHHAGKTQWMGHAILKRRINMHKNMDHLYIRNRKLWISIKQYLITRDNLQPPTKTASTMTQQRWGPVILFIITSGENWSTVSV
jgi:hypothetical protein